MGPSELRELSLEELRDKEKQLGEELFNLKMRRSMGQLENPMNIRLTRRDIARVKTFINIKQMPPVERQG